MKTIQGIKEELNNEVAESQTNENKLEIKNSG